MIEILENIDYHITDVCNLNCVSCGHFCSLVPASTKHKSISTAIKDFDSLYKVTENGKRLKNLNLTGGEASISDQFAYIIELANKYFPEKLTIWTNGIKYSEFDKLKDIIISTNCKICMTDYGKTNDHTSKAVEYFYREFGNLFHYTTRRDSNGKLHFFRVFFDLINLEDNPIEESEILKCYSRYTCLQLQNRTLYICQYAAYIHYLLEHFKDQITQEVKDKLSNLNGYLELNDNTTYFDIVNFIETSYMPMCKYCVDLRRGSYPDQEWKTTDKDITEWLIK